MAPRKEFVKQRFIKPRKIESRAFQAGLAESAFKGGNSLVVAPTALGKTIVAVLVIAKVLESEPEKKLLLLAPTKPLCEQHLKTILELTTLGKAEVTLLTGSLAAKKRAKEWEQAKIVVATPQTIENDVRNDRISLGDVSLIVFDEAHRAVGEYAYVYIAGKFAKKSPKGTVLGLTASPGGKEAHIKEVCRNLFIKNIEIKVQEDEDVKPYSHEIKLEWHLVELPPDFKKIKALIESFMKKKAEVLQKFGLMKGVSQGYLGKKRLIDMQLSIRKRIAAGHGKNPALYTAASAVAALMKASHAHTLLETQGVNALHDYLQREQEKLAKASRATKQFLGSVEIMQSKQIASQLNEEGIIHPKFKALSRILKEQFELNPESKAIVFNHYRDSIKRLVQQLAKMQGIRPERFVGQADKGKEKGMSQKEQAAKIAELKEGKINCIVASSVAEEGLDIPSVDLVVFYEPMPSEIRFIQRRGRTGRLAAGRAVILMAKGTRDETYYWTSVAKERKMHRILHKMQKGGKASIAAEKKKPKQTTLQSFNPGNEGKIVVFVDSAEKSSGVSKMLQELGCDVVERQLLTGDYVPGKEIVVERKSVSDFLSSIVDGRLGKQLLNMTEAYERPVVIVEGSVEELFNGSIHRNAVIGMLTSIALNYRIPVLFTGSARETAQYIFVIAKREQMGKGSDVRLRIGRKGLSLGEQQRFVVESLPLVGSLMAKKLLHEFKSVRNIANALSKDLQKVDNMGEKKARQIKKIFRSEYKE